MKELSESLKEKMTRRLVEHYIVLTHHEQKMILKHFPKITFSLTACAAELIKIDEDIKEIEELELV